MRHPHAIVTTGLSLMLAGCGGFNIWPFGGKSESVSGRAIPADTTEYRCDGNKTFQVRPMSDGKSMWVIFPDRQVRLENVSSEQGRRYGNGIAVLSIDGPSASLTDGPSIAFANCSAASGSK